MRRRAAGGATAAGPRAPRAPPSEAAPAPCPRGLPGSTRPHNALPAPGRHRAGHGGRRRGLQMAGHLAMQEAVRAGTPHPHPTLGFLLSLLGWPVGAPGWGEGVSGPSQTSGSPLSMLTPGSSGDRAGHRGGRGLPGRGTSPVGCPLRPAAPAPLPWIGEPWGLGAAGRKAVSSVPLPPASCHSHLVFMWHWLCGHGRLSSLGPFMSLKGQFLVGVEGLSRGLFWQESSQGCRGRATLWGDALGPRRGQPPGF